MTTPKPLRLLRDAVSDPRWLPSRTAQAGWQAWSRLRRQRIPQPDGEVLCRALGRYPMLVSADDVGLAPWLIRQGSWELWIARFLRRQAKPGMVCLDAGANVGYFTLLMADRVGPSGRVIAAEPIPATFSLLERNITLNGFSERVRLVRAALGAATGQDVELMIPQGEPKNAMVQPPGVDYSFGRSVTVVTAPMTTVDALDLPHLDLVKIDVEGQEDQLWSGMSQTLARSPDIRIVMEVNGGRGSQVADFLEAVAGRFPLRHIDTVGNLRSTTIPKVMSAGDDVMLYLARG